MTNRTRAWTIAGMLMLAVVVAGIAYAQPAKAPPKVVKVEVEEMGEGPDADMDMPGMMPDLPPEVEKKLVEAELKFTKDNASLRNDMQVKCMEMMLLWLEDEPNADKIVAKLGEINKLQLQLRTNEVRHRLATAKLLPEDHRKGFLRGCCGGMGPMGRGMMRGGMGMMRGKMGMGACGDCDMHSVGEGMKGHGPRRIEKKIIKLGGPEEDCGGCEGKHKAK